ncbi:TonB-dependent receptor [Parapedomonas caeni]
MNLASRARALKHGLLTSTTIIALTATAAATAMAAEEQAAGPSSGITEATLGDIVVTARQRNETLISAPVAVSAMSAEQLERFATTDIRDVGKLAPSLSVDQGGSGNGGIITLRGVGTSNGQAGFDQAVSISVDGVQIGRARILRQGLFDMAQIEVLKGPQALFFGKNSPAGVVALKSANPGDELEGYVRSSYEFAGDEAIIDAAVSGPLSESFGARLAVRYRNLDGYFRNTAQGFTEATYPFAAQSGVPTAGGRRPGEKEIIGRATFVYRPVGSNFDANLKLSASDNDTDGPSTGAQPFNCGGLTSGITSGVLDPYGDCKFDRNFSRSAFPAVAVANWPYAKVNPYGKARMYLAALTANYAFDNLTLTSVTGYFRSRSRSVDNYDATSILQLAAAENEKYSAFSQELRLLSSFDAPVNFMLGAYYQGTKLDFFNSSRIAPLGADPANGKYQTWEKLGHTDGDTYSIFSQMIWDVTDQIELAGGVRYTHETKDSDLRNTYVHPPLSGTLLAPTSRLFVDNFKDDNFSPEATLTWRPTDDLTTYVAYKTGYKSGGFGLSAVLLPATISEDAIRFDSEKVKGFEGGVKAQLLDRRLVLTSSLYSYKYSNLQVNAYNPATSSFTIENAASSRVKGVELEARFSPMRDFSLYASVAYNRARYIEFVTSCFNTQTAAQGCNIVLANGADGLPNTADDTRGQNLGGKAQPRAPEWAVSLGFDYAVPVTDDWGLGFNGNARYSSKYNATDNGNINGWQKSFWQLDAGVRLKSEDDRWQLALIGRNLTNELYALYLFEKPGTGATNQIAGQPSRGRQVMLEATWRY